MLVGIVNCPSGWFLYLSLALCVNHQYHSNRETDTEMCNIWVTGLFICTLGKLALLQYNRPAIFYIFCKTFRWHSQWWHQWFQFLKNVGWTMRRNYMFGDPALVLLHFRGGYILGEYILDGINFNRLQFGRVDDSDIKK